MAWCHSPFVLLASLFLMTAAKPVDRILSKRETAAHQIVEVPQAPLAFDLSEKDVKIRKTEDDDRPVAPPALTSSSEMVQDHNDISQATHSRRKQVAKSNEQSKKTSGTRKGQKRGKKSNTDLLHHLGMTKLRSPPVNHHRKRLASQSRKTHHQKNNIDSKMFVIKLPPNPYYYAHHDLNGYDIVEPQPKSVNNVPVSFNTNGKPSKIYHWNIPVLKKMVARKAGSSPKSTIFADSDIFNIDKQATWNETDDDKSLYRKATYYGPKKQSKHTFRKYFAGNGKPHSFYVMEKSKKPGSVHRLLP